MQLVKSSFGDAPKRPKPQPQEIGVKAYDHSFAIVASDPEVPGEQIRITRLEPARPPTTSVPQLRDELVDTGHSKLVEVAMMRMWSMSLRTSLTYRLSGWGQKAGFRMLAALKGTIEKHGNEYTNRGWVDHIPGPVKGWTSERDMITPPKKSFRHWWRQREGGS